MIYSLPNGKAIEMTIEQFLRMSDDELQQLVMMGLGEELSDPFHGSVLPSLSGDAVDPCTLLHDEYGLLSTDLSEETGTDGLRALTDIPDAEKLCDTDYMDLETLGY